VHGLYSTDLGYGQVVGYFEHGNEPLDSIKGGEFFTGLASISFSRTLRREISLLAS
jgi:hypothetical protein